MEDGEMSREQLLFSVQKKRRYSVLDKRPSTIVSTLTLTYRLQWRVL